MQRAVADASLPLKMIESRTKPWFGGDTKEYDTLLTIPIEKTFREAGGRVTEQLVVGDEVMAYCIMRGALQVGPRHDHVSSLSLSFPPLGNVLRWIDALSHCHKPFGVGPYEEALMDTLPDQTLNRIKFNKSLVQINGNNNDGISIGFNDGSTEGPFDLVVGCDGVGSAVKSYVSNDFIPQSGEKGSQSLYSGIRIRYAVQDTNVVNPGKDEGATLSQYFGNGAYALEGIYGAGKGRNPIKCAFTIYLDDDYIGPFIRKKPADQSPGLSDENADWSQDNRKGTCELMLEQIQECNVPGAMNLRPIIEEASRFFELGVYFHSPFSKNGWRRKVPNSGGRFCTLGGDAAHAMPPFLGQGSNQAIQDAYCLAKKIFEYNKALANDSEEIDFEEVLKSYETVRWGPTASISAKAFLLGYLEAGVGFIAKFRDVFFFTLGSLGVAKKVFLGAAVPEVGDGAS